MKAFGNRIWLYSVNVGQEKVTSVLRGQLDGATDWTLTSSLQIPLKAALGDVRPDSQGSLGRALYGAIKAGLQ